ncbi:S8 family peptidase [Halocatena pleomorpha]|uniref:Peptidase S8 n=1 Tax=Halocatena pleomorpha TaxID=1785090 RepID=A0A3P3RFX7_9EURY|nr:S8 family serine peptidase [Halocatena pleomorpha]RRJ31859.1 peptidase S8 [Halocatena pleomorpha]
MARYNRRTFLRLTGVTFGAATFGAGTTAGATGKNSRFLIDLREVPRSAIPSDVEIIHDISQIDLLAARGDPSSVGGKAATTPDIKVDQHDGGPAVERDGPTVDEKSQSHNHDGAPTNTELQWDKRVQNVGDLTDKPGGGTVIHDTTKGEGTRVAVVDTGVYDAHPDLQGVVNDELSENFTTDRYDWRPHGAGSHGTHVAGTIAATNSNDGPAGGVLGTAPETEIVAHRVFSGVEGEGASTGDTIAALAAAADKGCDAANFSVGYMNHNPEKHPELREIKAIYQRLSKYVRKKGMVFVNSAGNSSLDMDKTNALSLPTEVEGVFGVAATGPIGCGWGGKHSANEEKWLTGNRLEEPTAEPAFYTNYGSAVDVSAAGGNADLEALDSIEWAKRDLVYSSVYKTTENGNTVPGYGWKAGTSMAAPQVTGAVALVRSLRPTASVEEVESLIKATASDAPGDNAYHGAGHLNLKQLVKRA